MDIVLSAKNPKGMRRLGSRFFLPQSAFRRLIIQAGIAIGARLVQSASHPLSEDVLEKERRVVQLKGCGLRRYQNT